MVCYTDTSALSKRYVQETGSTWLKSLLDPSTSNEVYIVRLTAVELIAALTRRERGRTLSAEGAALARANFQSNLARDYQVIEATEGLIANAMQIAQTHALRGYDAVQLAAAVQVHRLYVALGLPPILFVSADTELNTAARTEGLQVENPNDHP